MLKRLDDRAARNGSWPRFARGWKRQGVVATVLLLASVVAHAAGVGVTLHAPNGGPVAGAVVVLESTAPAVSPHRRDKATARIEQRDRRFVPQVIVVQTGTLVEFPNNDTVSHQVYSFSPARRFQLSLYKGTGHAPIEFDKAGLVVLGCNIHDDMIGYILVTDSPYFAQTDVQGRARISGLPAGAYRLRVWAPRIADAPASLERLVQVGEAAETAVDFALTKALLAAPTPRPGRAEWDAY